MLKSYILRLIRPYSWGFHRNWIFMALPTWDGWLVSLRFRRVKRHDSGDTNPREAFESVSLLLRGAQKSPFQPFCSDLLRAILQAVRQDQNENGDGEIFLLQKSRKAGGLWKHHHSTSWPLFYLFPLPLRGHCHPLRSVFHVHTSTEEES